MKTTVEVPDNLYRRIKAQAALRGQTVKTFFLEALREKLNSSPHKSQEEVGWRAVFGKARKEDMDELQRILDEDHRIDPEGWDLPGLEKQS